ncbi:glycosyltransferase family 4 protein, partial [Gammaproteobacteria bacterium]|nr:glycosyltransferase family 4 protein [Gammaproteobacteria bacterium]
MSIQKYQSFNSLIENIAYLEDKADLDKALRVIHDFVERIITEPMCTSLIFGSKNLDDLCQSIGKKSLLAIERAKEAPAQNDSSQLTFVYIVTKLQKSGGHTRVISDFIKARPEDQHVILSTELDGRSDPITSIAGLAQQATIIFEQAPKGNYQQRLTWLQTRLLNLNSKKVYLFNHHQDSVAVGAIQPEMNLNASFYHHGDHHLCLGVYLSHLEHIDFHPMGYHNCRDTLGIDNIYIPLSVEDKGARPAKEPFCEGGVLTTCTAARSNKIEVPYCVDYLEVIPELLKATGGRHIHIGRLTPWALFKIRRRLKRLGVPADRFEYTPWVPSVWQALHECKVDLYIASFPYGGGLTLIEVMGAGIPVALHRHIFCRILSGVELAYPEAFSWRFAEELLDYCGSVKPEELEQAGRLGRAHYEKFYAGTNLRAVLDGTAQEQHKPSGLSDKFTIETD